MGRGMLTEEIKFRSKELFGDEISTKQLRLLPYIIYVATNTKKLDYNKLSIEEENLLDKWDKYIKINDGIISITKEFWDKANEIIYIAYVNCN